MDRKFLLTTVLSLVALPAFSQSERHPFPAWVIDTNSTRERESRITYQDQWDGATVSTFGSRYVEVVASGSNTIDSNNYIEWDTIDCQTGWYTILNIPRQRGQEPERLFISPNNQSYDNLNSVRSVCLKGGVYPRF